MIEEEQAKRLGAQIKALRLSRNESQQEFGKNFSPSVARSVVSRWESGKRVPRAKRLAKIAEMSGKTVTELLNGTTSDVVGQIAESQMAEKLLKIVDRACLAAIISRWENNKGLPQVKSSQAESLKKIIEIENGDGKNSLKTKTLPKMNFLKATITGMNGKQFTEYLTPFKDDVGDDVTFVYDTDIKAYTDDAYCMFELTNAGIDDDYQHRIMQKVADEYGCEFSNNELLSNDSAVLLQAMLAVYAWLKLKEMD